MQAETLAEKRLALRLSGDFVLRWAELFVHLFGRDHLSVLVFNTFLNLNVRHILEDPVLNLRYAGLEAPPDEDRRPVTIAEAAQTLAMPPATVGRYVRRMTADGGMVRRGREGYVIPRGQLLRSDALASTDPHFQNSLLLVRRLRRAGLIPSGPAGPLAGRPQRYRYVLRLAGQFVSDWMAPWAEHYPTGYLYGLVFAAIMQANDADDGGAVDDAGKIPISAYAVAASLGLPTETVRRYMLKLEADGLLLRSAAGYIVPIAAFATEAGQALLSNAQEAIGTLSERMISGAVDVGD